MECLNVQGFYLRDSTEHHHCRDLNVCGHYRRDENVSKISRQTCVHSDLKNLNKNHELAKVGEDGSKYSSAFQDPLIRTFGSWQALANASSFGSMEGNNVQVTRRRDSMSDKLDKEVHKMSKKSVPALARRSRLSTSHLVNYSSESFGYPSMRQEKIKVSTGVVMALAVAALGISTAAKKGGLFARRTQNPTKLCVRCYGTGVERCDICNGRGKIEWEGKLKHFDPCPLCFGSLTRKCTACDGKRSRNTSLLSSRSR